MNSERRGLGPLAWVVAVASLLHVLGLVVLAAAAEPILGALASAPGRASVLQYAIPPLDLVLAAVCAFSALRATRIRPGTPGKLRTILLGVVGTAHYPVVAAVWFVFLHGVAMLGRSRVSTFISPLELFYILDPANAAILRVLTTVAGVSAVPLAALLFSYWFVLPEKPRARFFFGFDALVAVVFVYAIAKLPIAPVEEDAVSLTRAIVRHTITALFAMRAFARLLPHGLDLFERWSVRTLIAARHLRSRRSSFLAAISFLSILAVSVSTCLLSVVLSVMGGFRGDLERKILGNSAHVVVDRTHGTFEGWDRTIERIRHTEGVVAASPYVEAEVMITSASNFAGALIRGIEPSTAAAVTALGQNLRSDRRRARGSLELLAHPERIDRLSLRDRCPGANRGELLPPSPHASSHSTGPKPPRGATDGVDPADPADPADPGADGGDPEEEEELSGILLGSELARSLRLCVGDDLEVVSPLGELGPAGPVPKTRRFRVAGIFYSGMYEYDMKHVYVTLDVAQSFLRSGDALSGIEVRVASVAEAGEAARRIRRGLGRDDLRVEDWRRRNRSLFGALALEKLVMFVTLGITVLIAGFCVFATLTLMVHEKRREVGILKAMGADDGSIIRVFLSEGLLIGLLGATGGLGLGWLTSFFAEHLGVHLNAEVYYIDRLPVHVDPLEFIAVGVSAAIVCVLSTIFPAVYASRLRPVDAVRHD